MTRYEKRLYKIIGSLLLIIFFLIGYAVQSQEDREFLEVAYLDVEQGDAILIKTPFEQNILIDGGPDKRILSQLGSNLSFFDKKIDLMILTHPHSDHVAGLIPVLRNYQVDKVLLTGVLHTSPDYLTFLEEIKTQRIVTEIVNSQRDIVLGDDLVLKILYPWTDLTEKKVEELNNTSIVAKLVYKGKSFLFTGDAEEQVEWDLINNGVDLSADILKVGHHGSKTATTQKFLDLVKPQYAIIQCGLNNDFGHPHLRTLQSLEQRQINVLRNDLVGTIIFTSDGTNLTIKKGSSSLP